MESNTYSVKITNHLKTKDYVEYEINLVSNTNPNFHIKFYERYSKLKVLHDQLRKETTATNFPKFPPKKFWGSTDEKFLAQRQTELNVYLNALFSSNEFSNLPSLQKWIKEAIAHHKKTEEKAAAQKVAENKENDNNKLNKDQSGNVDLQVNKENEIARIRQIIEIYSKKFISIEQSQDYEYQENEENNEIEKEYNNICTTAKIFASKDNSNLVGKIQSNYNDTIKAIKVDDNNCQLALDILNKFINDFYPKIDNIYDTKELLINFNK